jgi:sugar phosphate isomerase/epimerase
MNSTADKAPPGIFYAGIGDEAGAAPEQQISALRALGWSAIELRTVDGAAVADLDDAAFAVLADQLTAAELHVVCLDSRIGNWSRPVTAPFEQDIAELRILAPRCHQLGTRYVRVMSYPNAGLAEPAWREEVVRRMRTLASYAEGQGLVLLHENCAGWAGSRADRMLELLASVDSPALRLLFDTGNGIPYGYDSLRMLREIVGHVEHVHIKDAVPGPVPAGNSGQALGCDGARYTFPGHGAAAVADCLRALLAHDYTGAWSIEPHLALRPHEGRDDTAQSGPATFAAYGRELQRLVRDEVLACQSQAVR